ncbi:hypothetical protein SAMD00023353_2101300 [Rosellinia necatrix]|uniref:Uncharacterized protein n=1 Tax=Rosellinia necatrix TaxID=77044 RepID=A0A1W2TFC3_ROSNE|nr:hypothetical protein SAMD00023353_2101300 [Rosellinia necatrix]
MPVEIVTIVNSSGKIISNGKHLVNAFKEAKAAYDEKKAALKAERAVRRCQTFDIPAAAVYQPETNHEHEYGQGNYDHRRHDDAVSQVSSRGSHRSGHSRASRHRSASQTRPALTVGNLRTHSEVSSVTPSRAPAAYRSPYAETAPRDMALSRPALGRAPTMPAPPTQVMAPMQTGDAYVQRSRSDPSLQEIGKKKKEIDMNLAYGSMPPDLEDRVDLDPAFRAAEKEDTARDLVGKIEDLLVEAECAHHTATHIIEHLQARPEAAAAVALTLAELSAILGKMSPSFLAVLKGGSPAIFALLASPQFLIAAGVTVGVTIVMFGGWKIIKRIQEAKEAARVAPMAVEAHPVQVMQAVPAEQPAHPPYPPSEASQGFDEALVVEEELSTIETWRRGITPFGEDGTADLELISPEADRAIRSQYGGDDAQSIRTTRTHKSSKSHKSHKSHKPHRSRDSDIPERKSSRLHDKGDDAVSESGSHRSHRSHKSHRTHQSHRTEKTEKTERTSGSKRTSRTEVKAIEDGSRDRENTIEAVLRPKKDNMLKSLFKKKKKDDEELKRSSSSMLRV